MDSRPDPAVASPHSRLGGMVRARRLALGLTQRQAAVEADVSDSTWLAVEQGQPTSERTLFGVDRALRWTTGSAQRTVDGGKPTNAEQPAEPAGALTADQERRLVALEQELAELREQLGLPPRRQPNGDIRSA